jgi:hypothetical protein
VVEIREAESCLACKGQSKLPNFRSGPVLVHPCPWCDAMGLVHPEINACFRRIDKTIPSLGKFCVVFGRNE